MRVSDEKNVNIDIELHKKLKLKALQEGMTLKALIYYILKKYLDLL